MNGVGWRLGWWEDLEERLLMAGVVAVCTTPGCVEDASVYDRETGQGLCFDCHELLIDRQEALAINRNLGDQLPPLNER